MEFTIVQEGYMLLTAEQMECLVTTLDVFFQEGPGESAIRFDELVEALMDGGFDWSDLPRLPTALEIMAACCTLERRGLIQTEFIGGIMHFAETRATSPR